MHFARERTIMLCGRSKIERSTGLRFGEIIMPKEAKEYIAKDILKGKLDLAEDLTQLITFAKSPGGIRGEFYHVTFVPGPCQYLGIAHMVFGEEDRREYLKRIRVNMETFHEILDIPYYKIMITK